MIRPSMFFAVSLAVACAGPRVRPDDMSAAQHRESADRERALAREDAARYDPGATRVSPLAPPAAQDSTTFFPASVYNPTEGYLREADKHRAHAREHEAAAQALERFEQAECREFPERTRAACPLLGPVARIDDIDHGVRVTFTPKTRVDAVYAHMRCHYAYARSRAFDARVGCPLYMPGIDIRRAGALGVDLVAKDGRRVDELRNRSREEAVYAGGGGEAQ
ncbi:MAG TPA: hypothetical protein VHJ20_10945 [Polyangia bacterium]|nr:hypothetical protein [Polyangia bacterium]